MNARVQFMERNVTTTIEYADELKRLRNQRKCMRAAAEVVSSASTIVGSDGRASTRATSDFNDVLPPNPSESMLRWFEEAVPGLYEEPDEATEFAPTQDVNARGAPGIVDGGDIVSVAFSTHTEEDSDSDGEMETEIVQLQLVKGEKELLSGNFEAAEKMLRNGLTRLNQHRSRHFGTELKLSVSHALLNTYTQQGKWAKAKEVTMERLAVLSGHSFEKSGRYLDEAQSLAGILLKLGDTVQARIYAKKCIKAYREQGSLGCQGLEQALGIMIAICRSENNTVDEEAFRLLLAHSKEQDPGIAPTLREHAENSSQQIFRSSSRVQISHPFPYLDALAELDEMSSDEEPLRFASDVLDRALAPTVSEKQARLTFPLESHISGEQRSTMPSSNTSITNTRSYPQNGVSAAPEPDLGLQKGNYVTPRQGISVCPGNLEVSSLVESVKKLDDQSKLGIDQTHVNSWSPKEGPSTTSFEPCFNRFDRHPVAKDWASCQVLLSDSAISQQRATSRADVLMNLSLMNFQDRVSLDAYYKIAETEDPSKVSHEDGDTELRHNRGVDHDQNTAQPADVAQAAACANTSDESTRLASATPSTLMRLFSSSEESESEFTELSRESSVSS